MTNISELKNLFYDCEQRINQLKRYQRQLEELDITGFEKEAKEIKKHIKDPNSTDIVNTLLHLLIKKINEKNRVKTEKQSSLDTVNEGINNLLIKNKEINVEDIKTALINDNLAEALDLLKNKQTSYDNFIKLQEESKEVDLKIKKLTKRVADGELDSDAFKQARDDLEIERKEIEEKLWKIRNKLFRETYEKPF
jgi:hypothetical protein